MSRRKAEMVLELVDRATRPARRFIALQRRMGKAVELANRISTRTASAARKATDLYKRATQGLGRAQDALQRGVRRSNDLIRRQVTQMRAATGMMRSGVMGMGRAALLAGGMFAAYSGTVALAGSAMLGPARQFENFSVQLESIEGSATKGRAAMEWIEKFATRTPLELAQVVEAYQQMRTFGMDPTNGSMMALVDTMAASGKGAEQLSGLVLALGKSWTKGKFQGEEIMMLMERGVPVYDILGEKLGKTALQIQKMASAGKLGRKEIQLLIDGMAERNAGASEKMSKTWDGIISNLMDWWTRFQRLVMGFGVFDWMKDKLRGVLDMLNAMEASGELEVWAKSIADHILIGLNALWAFGTGAIDMWSQVYPIISSAADALGGWRNLALAILAIPFRGVILGAAFAMLQFAGGAGLAIKALAGIGFGSAASGSLLLGQSILGLLNPINWVKGAFIALRVAFIATGIGALVAGLAMAGTWVYNNWSGLSAFFQAFGSAFMSALGPAKPLAEGVINLISRLWTWVGKLIGPLDASAAQWSAWGKSAGDTVANVIGSVVGFVGDVASWFAKLPSMEWSDLVAVFTWDNVLTALNWLSYLAPVRWLEFIPGFEWSSVIDLFTWDKVLTALNWLSYLAPVRWLDFIPGFSWADIIEKLNIAEFIADFAWSDLLPSWDWSSIIPSVNLGQYLKRPKWLGGSDKVEKVQERAKGGSFNRGWLLTGEQGPELEYRSKGGFIAHNKALQNMVGMSDKINKNAANSGAQPSWLKGAAVASAIAASSAAMPAAATEINDQVLESGAPSIGAKYLTKNSSAPVSVSAPLTLTIQGNVDASVMPDLKAALEEFKEEFMEQLSDNARAQTRTEHE